MEQLLLYGQEDVFGPIQVLVQEHQDPGAQHPLLQQANKLLQSSKNLAELELAVSDTIDVIYTPTHMPLTILLVDIPEMEDGQLVYIESSSHQGLLALWDLPKGNGIPIHKQIHAQYERDPDTRKVSKIYIHAKDVIKASFFGTLDDLTSDPRIKVLEADSEDSEELA